MVIVLKNNTQKGSIKSFCFQPVSVIETGFLCYALVNPNLTVNIDIQNHSNC